MNPARNCALKALIQFRRENAWTDLYLKNSLSQLSSEDAALCTAITYGVLQNMSLIDHYISHYSSIKLNKIMPQVLDALRCGVYQIVFMDRIPIFASVNETVALVKKHANPRAGAFANAVLRKIAADKDNLPNVQKDDPIEYLSVRYSHPYWLTKRLSDQFGYSEAEQIMAANNTEAPAYIRVNTLKNEVDELIGLLKEEGADAQRVQGINGTLLCRYERPLHQTEAFRKGLFYIQDLASQLAVTLLAPTAGDSVIDMCSAPGGKSIVCAQLMQNKGSIKAFDVHEHKINIIDQNASKYGIDIISAAACDSTVLLPRLVSSADRVICDVPCSGLGIIRKKPDIRFKSEDSIKNLPEIQYKILKNAAAYVKPGGRLLYSTCTVINEENSDIIKRFLSENGDFVLSPFDNPVTGTTNGCITLLPHKHNCDGFFIALLDRKK
ncbi:MAG: 16S rRNA (cytosine(967)-C(5))-methyltransferase RsmB [Clostridia bacterium]|nr:16S rRNA (cytosine(967)-C(5))-methyltransferase RsmB [Clostridia bacterium]